MVYYHVFLTLKDPIDDFEERLDLSKEQLEGRFVKQYYEDNTITTKGRTIKVGDIKRMRILQTALSSVPMQVLVKDNPLSHGLVASTKRSPVSLYIERNGQDVTDEYIIGPPGCYSLDEDKKRNPPEDAQLVFVIHGRNLKAREELFIFLRSIGLQPMEWSKLVHNTGKTMPHITEILDVAFNKAHAVIVLITPDDEARLKETFRDSNDPPHETTLSGQARPNVLFEAGMAMGRNPEKTIIVELGNIRPFSDIAGLHVIRMDNSSQRRHDLARRLEIAGCPVVLDGNDWHSSGDLEATIMEEKKSDSKKLWYGRI